MSMNATNEKINNTANTNNSTNTEMRVLKRNGTLEDIAFDKILNRVKKIGIEANININYSSLVIKVIDQLYDKIPTTKIDELTAEQCASLSTKSPDYGALAGRIVISNHQKNTPSSFMTAMKTLYEFKDIHGIHNPLISETTWQNINKNADVLEDIIDYDRDYLIDYFGFKTLERAYLFRINDKIIERPQHMWLRVSIGIHGDNIKAIKESYNLMSQKYFTHATPTLFNAGTRRPQLSSCYLVALEEDSLEGIFNTLKDCANISKWAGGIGLHIHNVRSNGSLINGTNGKSTGIVPMLRVFNDTAKYINQGGKRNGSFAIYLEPWHADVEDFLEMKKNHGDEELRARDLFYALWIPDLFMERIKDNGKWSLFCPNECPGLHNIYGDAFNKLYMQYEKSGKSRTVVNARDLWFKILDAQMETGTPYLLFKDHVNKKSNQKNLGTIMSSNLCTEIVQYSDNKESSVCNLASIALPLFVDETTKEFDYEKLHQVAKVVTTNLNKIIDINFYPTEKTKRSNLLHRPIGIGVQGLSDVFFKMNIPYHSEEAKVINKNIFETIYHGALERSNELAIERLKLFKAHPVYKKLLFEYDNDTTADDRGDDDINYFIHETNSISLLNAEKRNITYNNHLGAYSSFEGSPASKGVLQFDMWGIDPTNERYNWAILKEYIIEYGLRNSLLVAPMPTASTSQILGFNECFEPITSNIYSRRTLAGEFVVVNKYLMNELIELGLWNDKIKNNIIANKGSVQQLTMIPEHIREKYKIVWEIPMKHLIDMSADRGAFICQSQSLNLWLEDPTYNTLTSMHFYSWKKGLKTGIYYLRRKAKHQAQQFTVEPDKDDNGNFIDSCNENINNNNEDEICEMCSA
jgi:ribonucleoside-diphosphate reductase alpha subunit